MDMADLVTRAANTLVAAAVTDSWEAVRREFARLFGRGQPDPAAGRRLDATRDQLLAAPTDGIPRVREELAGEWAVRLRDLLDDAPGLEAGLRELIARIQAGSPVELVNTDYSVSAGRDVAIRADRGSVAAGVIHGNVAPPGPQVPDPGRS
jgi:hypothetical protein